jgi:hypothetical protein
MIDASVAINLLGTGKPADLLRLLNRKVLIDELALNEVTSDPFRRVPGSDAMGALVRLGFIAAVTLSSSAFERMFLALTSADPPDDLGDGEAATLAHSYDIDAIPVIDERKATRIAHLLKPHYPILNTIDLLACPEITSGMARADLSELIYAALVHARMRVPCACRDWVASIVGMERMRTCSSIGFPKKVSAR